MAKTEGDIRRELEQALKGRPDTIMGRVKKVDADGLTCDIDNDGVVIYGVRLQCVTDGATGFVVYPAVGAQALCLRIEETDTYVVVNTSEIDQIIINGGQNGGLVNISSLTSRLNAIENDINNLKTAFTTWEVAPQDGGAALKAAAATWAAAQLTVTQDENYEDTKIKH